MLRDLYGIEPGEIDLCTFPLFALFAPALGHDGDRPRHGRDPARPGRSAQDRRGDRGLRRHQPVRLAGPPQRASAGTARTAWHHVCRSLRRVVSAGAPGAGGSARTLRDDAVEPGAQVFTPYGATEALPVASIGSDEILGETAPRDRPRARESASAGRSPAIERRDHPHQRRADPDWSDDLRRARRRDRRDRRVGPGRDARRIFNRPEATALAKIADPGRRRSGTAWATSAISTTAAGSGSAAGSRTASITAKGTLLHDPVRGGLQHAPRTSSAPPSSVSARPATLRPVLCVELRKDAGPIDERGAFAGELLASSGPRIRTRARSPTSSSTRLPRRHPPQREDLPREARRWAARKLG